VEIAIEAWWHDVFLGYFYQLDELHEVDKLKL
jgi:hypothetical protein